MENLEDLIEQAADDLANSTHAIALSGAGISTESNIPDFRGPRGIWTTDKEAEAKAYERYELFIADPKAYWEEVLYTRYGALYRAVGQAEPNPGHHALAELESDGVIQCVITQNIDGLHEKAGSKNLLEYHGSARKLRCISCRSRFSIKEFSFEQLPPQCRNCGRALKYDVVHFKEPIPEDVSARSEEEAMNCDLMLICGTSAVVYPFASLPRLAKGHFGGLPSRLDASDRKRATKVIEVNAEPTPLTHEGVSDYLIQGKTGEILPQIAKRVKDKLRQESG
jgi:NAD-dependent deacetylase